MKNINFFTSFFSVFGGDIFYILNRRVFVMFFGYQCHINSFILKLLDSQIFL